MTSGRRPPRKRAPAPRDTDASKASKAPRRSTRRTPAPPPDTDADAAPDRSPEPPPSSDRAQDVVPARTTSPKRAKPSTPRTPKPKPQRRDVEERPAEPKNQATPTPRGTRRTKQEAAATGAQPAALPKRGSRRAASATAPQAPSPPAPPQPKPKPGRITRATKPVGAAAAATGVALPHVPADAPARERHLTIPLDWRRKVPVVVAQPQPVPLGRRLSEGPWAPAAVAILIGAVGLVGVAVAFSISRLGGDWGVYPFWLGLLALFMPIASRLIAEDASREERAVLLVWLALALYLVKILHSPTSLDLYDELQHWRTASDIVLTRTLFEPNPLLITSSLFPGLEMVTAAVVQLTGTSIDGAGIAIIAVARVVLVLALFILFERISRSHRVAGVATLVYLANPSFLFFDAQFAYESMALGLGAMVALLLVIRADPAAEHRVGLTLVALACLGALVVTHHLTSYVFALLLVAWVIAGLVTRGYRDSQGVGWMALIGLVLVLAYLSYVAGITVSYLFTPVENTLVAFLKVLLQEEQGRALFQGATTSSVLAPIWERALGIVAAALVVVVLPFGAWQLWRSAAPGRFRERLHNVDPLALTLVILSAGFPATLALRFTPRGAEVSSRAASTLFIAVGLTVALAMVGLLLRVTTRRRRRVAVGFLSVIFMGNVIVGWPPWQRLPGPFLVGADSRSVNGESVALAEWALEVLGPARRFGADRTNTLLLGSHGREFIVWYQSVGIDLSPLWFSERIGPAEVERIRAANVEFLVVDRRLATGIPQTGIYFDGFEIRDGPHTRPIAVGVLEKFDATAGVSRIFDSGDIQVYDLRGLLGDG